MYPGQSIHSSKGTCASWTVTTAAPTLVLEAESDGGWEIRILPELVHAIQRDVEKWRPNETGGALWAIYLSWATLQAEGDALFYAFFKDAQRIYKTSEEIQFKDKSPLNRDFAAPPGTQFPAVGTMNWSGREGVLPMWSELHFEGPLLGITDAHPMTEIGRAGHQWTLSMLIPSILKYYSL